MKTNARDWILRCVLSPDHTPGKESVWGWFEGRMEDPSVIQNVPIGAGAHKLTQSILLVIFLCVFHG